MSGLIQYPEVVYTMGFKVGMESIPDPAVFSGAESDLDTMGERDATGYLHRDMVATKHPLKLEYHNIPWDMVMRIGKMLQAEKFNFTFPSPFTGKCETIEAYVGDRSFECVWSPQGNIWLGNLSFSIIEY